MSRLRLEGIFAGYGKKEVLRGISLSLEEGEILSLIGPNGAGKSTVLKVVGGFLKPWKGRVIWDGKDITDFPPYERRKLGMGYFMQGGRVFPDLTVEENLEIGGIGLGRKEKKERKEELLGMFPQLRRTMKRRAGLLSGGEKQALALAMLLMKKPEILLLDEPSAGLSPALLKGVMEEVRKINEKWGTTILLVEQKVGEALRVARRVVVLANGEVVLESESPGQLVESKEVERIFLGLVGRDRV